METWYPLRVGSQCSSLIGCVYVKWIPIKSEYSVAKHIACILPAKVIALLQEESEESLENFINENSLFWINCARFS